MGGKLSCSPDNCDVEVMQSLFRDCDKIEQEKAEKQQKEQTKQSERHTFLIYYFYLRPLLYFLFKYPQLP